MTVCDRCGKDKPDKEMHHIFDINTEQGIHELMEDVCEKCFSKQYGKKVGE